MQSTLIEQFDIRMENYMSQATDALDRLVGVVEPLIESSRQAAANLRAANARADAAIAELAKFRETDLEEDQVQANAQDAKLADTIDNRAAELRAEIDAAQAVPAGDPDAGVAHEEPAAPQLDGDTADQGQATEDAHVVVVSEAPADVENAHDEVEPVSAPDEV